jgi:hypothetical protein
MKTAFLAFIAAPLFAATSGVVHVEYYFSPGCGHCSDAASNVSAIVAQYAPLATTHVHRLQTGAEWLAFMARERVLGFVNRGPQAVYVGTTALYDNAEIVGGLETLITQGIAAGGVPRFLLTSNQLAAGALAATGAVSTTTWADRDAQPATPSLLPPPPEARQPAAQGVWPRLTRALPLRVIGIVLTVVVIGVLMVLAVRK